MSKVNRLHGPTGATAGLYLHLRSDELGPTLCLNACLDTAPFGDEEGWHHPPASGVIEDGRLYGRGSADSKIAVAIFSHLAVAFRQTKSQPCGELYIAFEADEHTGGPMPSLLAIPEMINSSSARAVFFAQRLRSMVSPPTPVLAAIRVSMPY